MTTVQEQPVQETPVRNGVDTAALFGTINLVAQQPELARFQFRAVNHWRSGTHSQSRLHGFYGAGQEHDERPAGFVLEADHPAVLTGTDRGPSPVEYLLHAIAACLTAGIGNIAAARGVALHSVESTVEGDIDLRGILGLSDEVRNGYSGIRLSFRISGDASDETLRAIVEQSRARSAVYDVFTNGVPVDIAVAVT